MNLLALSWFAKLQLGGHLWFVTGLLMLYGLIGVATRVKIGAIWCAIGIVGCVGAQIALIMFGVTQGWLLMMLMLGCAGFAFADKIIYVFKSCNKLTSMAFMTVAMVMAIATVNLYDAVALWIFYWPAVLAAIFLFLAIGAMSLNLRLPSPVRFGAENSYELYLVHYPFSGLSVAKYVLISLSVAWILHQTVGKLISNRSLKKP